MLLSILRFLFCIKGCFFYFVSTGCSRVLLGKRQYLCREFSAVLLSMASGWTGNPWAQCSSSVSDHSARM